MKTKSWIVNLLLLSAVMTMLIGTAEAGFAIFYPPRNLGPTLTVFDEVYGTRLKKNLSATLITPEFKIHVITNSQGQRGPEVNPSLPSVLFYGDSFTMGFGVTEGQSYVDRLRRAFHGRGYRLNFINEGIGGSGNGRVLKLLEREAARYRPAAVVLQITGNDFTDNQGRSLFTLNKRGKLEAHLLEKPPLRIMQEVFETVPFLCYSRIAAHIKQGLIFGVNRYYKAKGVVKDNDASRDRLTYEIIRESLRLCARRSWDAVMITVGCSPERERGISRIAREFRVPVIHMPGKTERPDLYYSVDDHWNPRGHRLAARRLDGKLQAILSRPF